MVEASGLCGNLAGVDPGFYNPTYAHILGSLALALVKNRQIEAALSKLEHCVTLYRTLYEQIPERFGKEFARNLGNLRILYLETGQTGKASLAADELKRLENSATDSEAQGPPDERS